jgi:aspartyl-tRNA synthetase
VRVPGGAGLSRSRLDKLTEAARSEGAKGLVSIVVRDGEPSSPVAKFLGADGIRTLIDMTSTGDGDALLLIGDEWRTACLAAGRLRIELAEQEGWAEDALRFAWITEFPLLEKEAGEDRLVAAHHPFTSVMPEDRALLATDPLAVRARSYDLVLNGYELGSGSIRNHRREDQERVFDAMGIPEEEATARFGFLLDALRFGAPPHGGIALGFDRIAMLLAGERSIRSTIAFPKTTSALDLMTDAPSVVDDDQLAALHIGTIDRDGGNDGDR